METSIRNSAVCLVVIGAWVLPPALSLARVNTLTTGLATSFDYTERRYDEVEDDPDTEVDETELLTEDEGDYRRFILTPLLQFTSISEQDSFELRLAPDLQYDFLDSDTDWAGTVDLSFARFISQSWQLGIENSLMRGDYYQTPEDATLEAEAEAEEPALAPAAVSLTIRNCPPISAGPVIGATPCRSSRSTSTARKAWPGLVLATLCCATTRMMT